MNTAPRAGACCTNHQSHSTFAPSSTQGSNQTGSKQFECAPFSPPHNSHVDPLPRSGRRLAGNCVDHCSSIFDVVVDRSVAGSCCCFSGGRFFAHARVPVISLDCDALTSCYCWLLCFFCHISKRQRGRINKIPVIIIQHTKHKMSQLKKT